MGWLAWERFRCNTDCKNDPDNCISDRLFRTMTDILVSEGYAAAGYEYINVDDCWPERERDNRGRLVPDRERFPYGMKSLADYGVSKKGGCERSEHGVQGTPTSDRLGSEGYGGSEQASVARARLLP
ncbi:alpha galactosidase A domain-containing protein [Phthorimaea operculella]|nr:alpha galactosidase A domain-containing protein [Phthorimaea operculella]